MISVKNKRKRIFSKLLFPIFILLGPCYLYAQIVNEPNLLEEEFTTEETNLANSSLEFIELTQFYKDHPINLNGKEIKELIQITTLSEIQLYNLFEHIKTNGPLISVYELQAIPSFNTEMILSLLPYITLKNSIEDFHLKFKNLLFKGDYQFIARYQQKSPQSNAFKDQLYLGKSPSLYFRYKYNYSNRFYYGLTAEKDPGEALFHKEGNIGFDFYSFHLFWKVNTKIQALAIGDYHLNLGQGLILWTGFGFKKSTNTCNIKKEGNILSPYTSINENNFLRGFAVSLKFSNFHFSPFVSYKKIDARINYEDSTENNIENVSLDVSGLHRTIDELDSKKSINELKTGMNLQLKLRKFHVGVNLVYQYYNKALTTKDVLYKKYHFNEKDLLSNSIDYHFIHKNWHFFGENALSLSKRNLGLAFLNGVIVSPSSIIDFSLSHRYYQKQYQSIANYTNAFGESTHAKNEHGIYLGIDITPSKKIKFSHYLDWYHFPWLKYQINKPSKGFDLISRIQFSPSKLFKCYVSFKYEKKDQQTSIHLNRNEKIKITDSNRKFLYSYFGSTAFTHNNRSSYLTESIYLSMKEIEAATFITPEVNSKLRIHLSFQPSKNWTLQNRVELSFFNDQINKKENGFLVFQDIKFKKIDKPYSFSTRITYFDIPSYSSRIYAYENDVLYQFSIPSFFNAGIRVYLLFQYKITKSLQVWFRMAHTYYSNIDHKGNGVETIDANKFYDLKMQLRYKF